MQAASYVTIYAEKAAAARARHAITTDARDADYLLREARKYENLSNGARESAARDAQRDAAKVEAVAPIKPEAPRCPHYKAIRTFMAVAREAGLNTANKKGMRAAFSAFLGRRIESRADLSGPEWKAATGGVRAGVVWW